MELIEFDSWEAFEGETEKLFKIISSQIEQTRGKGSIVSEPIFRGLSDASWSLETTLERFTKRRYTEEQYFKVMQLAEHPIASFLDGRKESMIEPDFQPPRTPLHPPMAYSFMIYLRHYGFPSPILDWTRSPYIAAFFAFRSKTVPKGDKVAIYAYVDDLGYGLWGSNRIVNRIGPSMVTDRRHHIQQCEYTFAVECDGHALRTYCNHESVFDDKSAMIQPKILKKYTIPYNERPKVLAKLNFMNINAYSLFGNEEGLMEWIAYREIERNEP